MIIIYEGGGEGKFIGYWDFSFCVCYKEYNFYNVLYVLVEFLYW